MRFDSIIIYSKDGSEKTLDCCHVEALAATRDIYGGAYTVKDSYYKVASLLDIKKSNQIAKAKREGKTFARIVEDQYFSKAVLYVPEQEADIQQEEISEEYSKGDKTFQDKYTITFKNLEFNAHVLESRFVKKDDLLTQEEINYNSVEQVEDILARLEHLKKIANDYQSRKKFLENKIAQGFTAVVHSRSTQSTNQLEIRSHVTRHEKTAERVALEKLTEELQQINERWSNSNTERLLELYNITKKQAD